MIGDNRLHKISSLQAKAQPLHHFAANFGAFLLVLQEANPHPAVFQFLGAFLNNKF